MIDTAKPRPPGRLALVWRLDPDDPTTVIPDEPAQEALAEAFDLIDAGATFDHAARLLSQRLGQRVRASTLHRLNWHRLQAKPGLLRLAAKHDARRHS